MNQPPSDPFVLASSPQALAERSAVSAGVVLAGQSVKFALAMATTAVMARLLTPAEFGLVAMASIATGFAGGVRDLGLPAATIRWQGITHAQVSTLFWINVALSAAVTLTLVTAAPLVAWFFQEPRVTRITMALAAVFFIDGIARQHEALLSRQMRFPLLVSIEIASMVGGLGTAMWLARAGFSYWALVAGQLVLASVGTVAIWGLSDWRPSRPTRHTGVRPMVHFGLNVVGFKMLNYAAMNADWLLIGRFAQTGQLGFYEKSYNLLSAPLRQITNPLTRVVVPALSRLQDDPERHRRFYVLALMASFALTMPIVAFLFVNAETVVRVLLGDQWEPVVPLLRALAPALFVGRFTVVTNWVFLSLGRADRQVRLALWLTVPTIAGYAIGILWGPIGVAAAMSVTTFACRLPGVLYCFRGTHLAMRDVVRAAGRPAAAALGAAAAVWWINDAWPGSAGTPLVKLGRDTAFYAAMYAGAWYGLPGGRQSVRELRDILLQVRAQSRVKAASSPTR